MEARVMENQSRSLAIGDGIADAFRRWGYLGADLDPFGRLLPEPHPATAFEGPEADRFRRIYSGPIGVEFMHIPDPKRCRWIQEQMERDQEPVDGSAVLDQLIRTDLLEQVLHTRYLGAKRFSIKGTDALIPLLLEVLETGAALGLRKAILAMSHRGRLSVVTNVIGRPAEEVFGGFEDVDPKSTLGGGDVKYHVGATGERLARNGEKLSIHLVSNPSHLEAVDPVALGRAKAWQTRIGVEGMQRVLPVLMHGDAAFAGQGILAETLNLSSLTGFHVGGTIHVIVNNLIGFTATPEELHSSRFASDVAKRLPIPIFHVNGEVPDAVVRVARIAAAYRYAFQSDVVVDLIGYRLYGHSEVDDPTITQPILYRKIQARKPLWLAYAEHLGIPQQEIEARVAAVKAELEEGISKAKTLTRRPVMRQLPPYWANYVGGRHKEDLEVETSLSRRRIADLGWRLTTVPEGFHIHPKVEKLLEQRRQMGDGEKPFDYGMAEAVAFASLVENGFHVRLSGQDCKRGTFNHRHSALIDTENGEEFFPLQHISSTQGPFECYDSMLSEAAVLGFEYGFSRDYPDGLICWEAQFGDFANGAQIIIDQFITAGEDKWELLSGLVMLLPHGYEGQGPEHSSARVERFLQLAARDNIQVAQPSTAAQHFHLLRRQALRNWRKPLVVFTPKSMLRHPLAMSPIEEFERPRFRPVLGDPGAEDVRRILICTGKIGHELRKERDDRGHRTTAVLFLEQLYPFPENELRDEFSRHRDLVEVVWVQEEPANMGALFFVEPRIRRLAEGCMFRSVKRSPTATPATGSAKAHQVEQKTLLSLAFARLG